MASSRALHRWVSVSNQLKERLNQQKTFFFLLFTSQSDQIATSLTSRFYDVSEIGINIAVHTLRM